MNRQRPLGIVAVLALAGSACSSSTSGSSRGHDGGVDSGYGAGGAEAGGQTVATGGTGGGAGGLATGVGGIGTGGIGTGGIGTGGIGTAKDASPPDGPTDGAPDAPLSMDGGTAQTDAALVCPDHVPVLPVYPYTPESCSIALTASKLRCTYTAPLVGADGGPACEQTFLCQCVSGQGGPPTCYWQPDANPACPVAVDAAVTPLCGGKVCTADEVCCGPAECGGCINKLTGPNCPSQCSASFCGPSGVICKANEICVDAVVSAGATVASATARCVTNACGTQALDCACAGNACALVDPQTSCSSVDPATGLVRCIGGGKCAAPDTPIATPSGNRPIAELRPGDLVYSVHEGAIVPVPLLRVARTPVAGHVVVHLVTARGAVLNISSPHPTADGRRFADLKVGDTLDGDPIIAREVVPYTHAFTYDILPASSTGTYLAAGLLIGSTLK
jgi:hypothetical protein